jgi:uncharacterized membrane protein
MTTNRLEAFSDNVIAIILTIMVLSLTVPNGSTWESFRPVLSDLTRYTLSFIFVGIYWNNHHHLMQAAEKINSQVLWANLHFLFWISLIPFLTRWMGKEFSAVPVALYGVVLLFTSIAYYILTHSLVSHHGETSKIGKALGSDLKGKVTVGIYIIAIPTAFLNTWIASGLYVVVAIMWLTPRILQKVKN